MCWEEITHLLALRERFTALDFQLTFIVKDDYASETVADKVDGERVYVDPELGFYHAIGFSKSSKAAAFAPTSLFRAFRAWSNGFSTVMDTTTDGLIHGGVLVIASPRDSPSGEAQVLFQKLETSIGDTLVHSPAEEEKMWTALRNFSNTKKKKKEQEFQAPSVADRSIQPSPSSSGEEL
eukprot:INCI10694.2.p1 GENE.INCI10694.2~~INCI10694.2.p1  ORF type:complete len:180 (+),score=41.67 INCI10694.2:460-999(+)